MPDGYRSDGEDMISALRGEPFTRTRPQFWHYQAKRPSLAARVGDWKLLMDPAGEKVELYDLAADPAESQNLSAGHPDVVESLRKALFKWRGELPFTRVGN